MTLEVKASNQGARCSKMTMIRVAKPLLSFSCLAVAAVACGKKADSNPDTTQAVAQSQPANPDAPVLLRGTVVSVTPTQVVLKVDTGNVTVGLTQPFHVYARTPSDLSKVTQSSFIGVTTVKQPDGSERATEIHVFPEELRGMGEGSRMMAPDTSAAASRMTNGNVSASRMTNGTASQSRMSNGRVSSSNGSSLVVQYAGGSQNVTVPANTRVTELKATSKPLAAGDNVVVVAKRAADGTLTSDKALSTAR
jgi:hypothetical protein